MAAVVEAFDKISTPELITKCLRFRSTNVNESIHARLYRVCKKLDHYSRNRLVFAAEYTMVVHNHGYQTGSLLHEYGFNENQVNRLRRSDALMYDKAAKLTTRRRDKKIALHPSDIHYHSNHGFENVALDPLPCTAEFEARKTYPWRSVQTPEGADLDSDDKILPAETIDLEPNLLDPNSTT